MKRETKGVTLVEVMVAMAVLSVGILGLIASFQYLNKGMQVTKGKSLANNLAQEKIETLKNKSYYRVLVTTETADDSNFSPAIVYDAYPNGEEEVTVGGIDFKVRVHVRKVSEDASGNLAYLNWKQPDTGLKEITVYVVWKEGTEWKKLKLVNIAENPERVSLSASFSGTVSDEGAETLENVMVKALENPSRFAMTDEDGNYSFSIEPGSYTLRASSAGYFSSVSGLISIEKGENLVKDFTLTKMYAGVIAGTAYKRDHLVISQVVGSTVNAGWDQEYVEIYNPTTYTWTVDGEIGLKYQRAVIDDPAKSVIVLSYLNASIPSESFYLFANTGAVVAGGTVVEADAVWSDSNLLSEFPDFSNQKNIIRVADEGEGEGAGGVELYRIGEDSAIDVLGWNKNDAAKAAPFCEGDAYDQNIGLQRGEQYVRYASSLGINGSLGPAYDTNNNNDNFGEYNPINVIPSNSSVSKSPVSGTPAEGAIAYADDDLSSPAIAGSDGNFTINSVSTGAWTVYISSGMAFISSGTFGGLTSGFSDNTGIIVLSSDSIYGYIAGVVKDINANYLSNILVYSAGNQIRTDGSGKYILPVEPGIVNVAANYKNDNANYVEVSSMDVTVELGNITKNVDFVLSEGGSISGWVTTNGVDPLPNIPLVAFKDNVAQGTSLSGSDGYFSINNLSSGTYMVEPQLESGESSSPSSLTDILNAAQNLFIGTFTVSGAMGYISGSVRDGSDLIKTGVLICATTSTITGNPPTIDSSLRDGSVVYYAVSSDAMGYYNLPVKGGYDYNIYAWYTTWSGDTPVITKKSYTAVTVTAGQSVSRNFSW